MQQVFLTKGQRFELVPAIVAIGEDESTKGLKIDHAAVYDQVLKGLPLGDAVVVGRFQAADKRVHPVIVERGTGKYFYDVDTVLYDPKTAPPVRGFAIYGKGKVYLGRDIPFTLYDGPSVKLGFQGTANDIDIDWGSVIDLANGKCDPDNVTDGISNGTIVGEFTDYDAEDKVIIRQVYLERFTERFYFYNT